MKRGENNDYTIDYSTAQVPHDSNFKMRADLLEECYRKATDKGLQVIAVAANGCSTATGTYDNLNAIAEFCERHNIWLHVDGAHGMGVLFSDKYRNKVSGIERADSVVIDFHKMFLVPALNTMVMFRNADSSFDTFSQKASYLFQKSQSNVWFNSATRTLECTKSALGIIAYTAMKYYGGEYYREYIESRYDLASAFARHVNSEPGLQMALEPESNIACFRYFNKEADDQKLNAINAGIRSKIVKSGRFYIVQAEIGGKIFLRLTIINPVTDIDHLKELTREVLRIGNEANNSNHPYV
jgi:L-2,4-diaminobutyrate decarboxylase